jgi:hypothetical protein
VWLTPPLTNVTATREPGGWDLTASISAVALAIGWPANRTITSPGCRPARAAGPPGVTDRAATCARAICAPLPAKLELTTAPSTECAARPVRISWPATRRASLIGMANPRPMLPPSPPVSGSPPSVSMAALIPITWAWAFTSGPPELPGLIGASVWIAS